MPNLRTLACLILLLCTTVAPCIPATTYLSGTHVKPHYKWIDLSVLPHCVSASAEAINNKRHIAGVSFDGHRDRLFLWHDGLMHDCGSLPNYSDMEAVSMNEKDEIVGMARLWKPGSDGSVESHCGFVCKQGKMSVLPVAAGCICYSITGISLRGEVVGTCADRQGLLHAFLTAGNSSRLLFAGVANGFNDAGQVVGFSGKIGYPDGGIHIMDRVLWQKDELKILKHSVEFTVPNREALINNSGTILTLNSADKTLDILRGKTRRAFSIFTLIEGALSFEFTQFNNKEQAAGSRYDDFDFDKAIVLSGDRVYTLEECIHSSTRSRHSAKINLITANGINERGEIVCTGEKLGDMKHDHSSSRAILLTPIN